jgi:hypothetical protein
MNYLLIASQPTIAVRLWTVFQFALIPAGQYGKVVALGMIILMAPMSFPSIFVAKQARLGWLMISVRPVVYRLPPVKLLW